MESRRAKAARLWPTIRDDLALMVGGLGDVDQPIFGEMQRHSQTYLKDIANPANLADLQKKLGRLFDAFNDVYKIGVDAEGFFKGKRRTCLALAFMTAETGHFKAVGGKRFPASVETNIRINNKAVILNDLVFAGTLLHEMTHIMLGTGDAKYAFLGKFDHKLKNLPVDVKYNNADNWRFFYQSMRTYIRKD